MKRNSVLRERVFDLFYGVKEGQGNGQGRAGRGNGNEAQRWSHSFIH